MKKSLRYRSSSVQNLLKVLMLLMACAVFSPLKAQEGIPLYSDYLAENLYLLHPSMAGASVRNQIRLTARQQWFDQNDAPNVQTVSVNARVGEQSGVGGIVFRDENGFHSQVGGYLTYAHHILLSRTPADLNQLSFGMNVGLVNSRLDQTSFDPNDFDPVIGGVLQSSAYFNIDIGASYNILDLSAHFTVKNLIFQNRDNFSEEFESSNLRRYITSLAYTWDKDAWAFEPSAMFQWIERTSEKIVDVNFKTYRELNIGTLWGGLSYRRSLDGAEFQDGEEIKDQNLQYVTPFLGITYKDFVFAYTYSYQVGTVRFDSGGFHQITLGYDFGNRKEPYDCKCPAIN